MTSPKRGFTLIELLVVMAIMGILVGLLLPAVQATREAARRAHCINNCRQIGLAIHQFESANKRLPSGWISDTPVDRPGWGWASFILPFIEQDNVQKQIDYKVQFSLPAMLEVRTTVFSLFECPSDTGPQISKLDFIPDDPPPPFEIGYLHDPPDTTIDLLVSKCNYSGVFGSEEIGLNPSAGNGVFFRNSKIRFKNITDGLSNTLIIGERRGDLGTVTWVGVEPLVEQSAARIVASADHPPNDLDGRFEDFRSPHGVGVHFVSADGSTRLISNAISLDVFRGLATRAGKEVVSYED